MNKTNWEKQLRQLPQLYKASKGDIEAIESFIRTLLSETRQQTIKKCVEVLEKMKKEELPVGLGHTLYGFNQALSEAQQKIKELV